MIHLVRLPLVLACLALAGCPSSSDDDADGGGGGSVQTCPDLCALAPVGSSEADCVGDFVSQANPSVALNAQCAAANDSVGACQSCYDAENVQDSTCAAAHRACFGGGGAGGGAGGAGGGAGGVGGVGGVGGGAGGAGGAGGGAGGAGGGGDVASCEDLCAFAPVDDDTADCVANYVVPRHPMIAQVPICGQANDPLFCLSCYNAGQVTDATCIGAYEACF